MRHALAAACLIASATAAAAGAPPPADLGGGVHLFEGAFVPGRQPDGNSLLLRGPDGWVLVDTGRHAAHSRRIADFIEASGEPLVAIVNTHWHLDHVSGNAALRERWPKVRVYASDAIDEALTGFLANSRRQLESMLAQAGDETAKASMREEIARIDLGAQLRPDEVVAAADEREFAGRPLRLGLTDHAATAADVWLYDASRKLLIAGDLVTLPAPFLDTACAPRWQKTLGELETTGFERLVPGHGAPMTRAQFATYRAAFDGLLECAASPAAPADCAQRWSKDAAPLLQGQDAGLTKGLIEYYVEHRLRGAGAAADCPAEA